MGHDRSSNRLWAGIAALALLVAVLFIVDPFDANGSDPSLDGSDDAPFVAVLQRDEVPSVEPDEVLGKAADRQVKAEGKDADRGVLSDDDSEAQD